MKLQFQILDEEKQHFKIITNSMLTFQLQPPSPNTRLTASLISEVIELYSINSFLFTETVTIVENGTCFSHPNLTLTTQFNEDIELLMANFLHEQFHWYVAKQASRLRAIVSQLRLQFPELTYLSPPFVARTPDLTYIHIVVCFLEQYILRQLLGAKSAEKIRDKVKMYLAVYQTIEDNYESIEALLTTHEMLPFDFLNTNN